MVFKKIIFLFSIFITTFIAAENSEKHIYLSERVASGNDWLINKGEANPIIKPFTSVTSRAISVTLFPVCTTIDLAVLATKQIHELPYAFLNKNSPSHQTQYRKNNKALKKTSLGLLTAPMGLISPDLVTHHFVPNNIQTFQLTPYGKLYHAYAHMVYPESLQDIQCIIKKAEYSGKSISVLGKLMSQGKQAISNEDWNIVINTSKLNQITIDPELKIAKVGAGASWNDLQRKANQYGLAVRVMQASNIFSIGGSISTNCHGWDYKTGCLRNTIIALTVVDSKGNILNITPMDPLFDFIVGGYGGFGVVVEATISLTDNIKMIENGVEIDPCNYVAYFNQYIRHNKNIDMHLYRLSLQPKRLFETGVAVNYQKIKDNQPVITDLIDEPERGIPKDRIKLHALRRLPWLRKVAWNIEKKDALTKRRASRNRFMRPPINPIFNDSQIDAEWLQEYFVKEEDLVNFLHFLGNILQKNKVAVFNATVRFVKQDSQTKLSYAQQGDRFAVVLFFNQKLTPKKIKKTKVWVRQVINYLIAHEGSYYLPYQQFATLEQFKACYPNWESIVAYKQTIDPKNIFNNGFYVDYLSSNVCEESLFRKVFNQVDGQRDKVFNFLHHVFMQLDEKIFFLLVDSILENPNFNDKEIYEILYNKIAEAKPNKISSLQQTLRSLNSLKNDLSHQTALLVNPKEIKGYIEIGYPGRMIRSLKKRIKMKGPIYVINDKESLSDYVESGFPRPYDQFVPLNNYEPISENMIPTASVDLVCMYIGLHHIPKEKLDLFVESIKRILKPGGIFILMEHDAYNQEMQNFVDVVHSIFNAATGVDSKLNNQEIRNFHSLNDWINYMESHGMIFYKNKPLIREGDSTLNSLIRFDKPIDVFAKKTMRESLILDSEHSRPQIHTYLTGPEWQNVRAAQRYAEFVENQPAYRYPYFSEISGFWKVYYQSWQAAQKQKGFSAIALSEYNLMNLFVGTTMTLEYGVKGLIAAPFALIDKVFNVNTFAKNKSPSDKERLRSLKTYGNYIENTPFYKYPYFKDIHSYWSTYLRKNKSFTPLIKGLFVGSGMTIEYSLKGLVSAPLSYFYGSETMKEAETTHLIIRDVENMIETIDPDIVVVESFPDYHLKHIEIPRYMRFTKIMLEIARKSCISCVNIAGHKKIQIDVKSLKNTFQTYAGTQIIYEIPAPTDLKYTYMALEVDVNQLCKIIRTLEKNNVEIVFIHDY